MGGGAGGESESLFERLKLHGYVSDMGSSETTHFQSKLGCVSALIRNLIHTVGDLHFFSLIFPDSAPRTHTHTHSAPPFTLLERKEKRVDKIRSAC